LKAKHETEVNRGKEKQKNRELGKIAEEQGDLDEAKKYYSRALVLKSKMVDLFMDILIELDVEFVVAPYEADA
jgi:exonuclease-1